MDINALYKLARGADRTAEQDLFSELSERFHTIAQQRIGNHQDCQEVVQEALMTVASRYKSIDFTHSFAAWACKILTHKIGDYHRSHKVRKRRFAPEEPAVTEATVAPDPHLKMRLMTCMEKVARAHPRHARILNLRYLGYDIDEICDRLRLSPNAVYILLHRARGMLKTCLEGKDGDQ